MRIKANELMCMKYEMQDMIYSLIQDMIYSLIYEDWASDWFDVA